MKIPAFLDHRELKKMCVYAYCHFLLEDGERQCKEGKGEICIAENITAREKFLIVIERIENMNYTHDYLSDMANIIKSISPKLIKWYDKDISGTVKKNFTLGSKWIPAVIVSSLLHEMKLRGHKEFEDIDFLEIISWYEKDERSTYLSLHFNTAYQIIDKLYKRKK
jgi:hypothetical protein